MLLVPLLITGLLRPPVAVKGFVSRFPGSLESSTLRNRSSFINMSKNTFNPFRMVGDVASNLFGGAGVEGIPALDQAIAATVQDLTWQTIRQQLERQMQTDDERNFRKNMEKGYGVGSPLHKVRLFDSSNKEEEIRVIFYRDSAR